MLAVVVALGKTFLMLHREVLEVGALVLQVVTLEERLELLVVQILVAVVVLVKALLDLEQVVLVL